jgi:hypothetical protein
MRAMGRIFKIVAATLGVLVVWAVFVTAGTREGWWRPTRRAVM